MGPIAHIIIYAIIWHAVIEIWQKMREKNGQMNVQIMKSQEKMGKVHSYHDTWLRALAVGRWFPPGAPVSSTRKLISSSFHRLDMTLAVAEALNP